MLLQVGKGYLGDNLFTIQRWPLSRLLSALSIRFVLHFPFSSFRIHRVFAHLIAPARENIKNGDVPCDTCRLDCLVAWLLALLRLLPYRKRVGPKERIG